MKKKLASAALALLLSACASAPDKITASSVSPLQYEDYNCKQISLELGRIEKKVNDLYYSLDKKAGGDTAQMAVGLVLFWPALFFLEGGDGAEAAEYGRLKGEIEALETVAIKKKCSIEFPKPPQKKVTDTKPANNNKAH